MEDMKVLIEKYLRHEATESESRFVNGLKKMTLWQNGLNGSVSQ